MSSKINFENICNYNLENKLSNNKYLTFPKNIGNGKIDIIELNDGLSIHYFDVKVKEDFILENKFEKKLFSFTIFLEGNMKYENIDFNFDKVFKTNTLIVSALNKENGLSYYEKDKHIKCMNICVDETFFKNFDGEDNKLINSIIDNINNKPYFSIINELSCNFNTLQILKNLLSNGLDKNFQQLYIQSKMYEFLYESFNRLDESKKHSLPLLEQKYLLNVKEYIQNNLYKDFTLRELAKIARSNETNLQKNFKLFFDTTVFKFILEQRMQKAKEFLTSNDYSINEISSLVGYKHQSNFTIAFLKRFGIRPKELMKTNRYY